VLQAFLQPTCPQAPWSRCLRGVTPSDYQEPLRHLITASQIEPAPFNFRERLPECGIVSLLGTVPGLGRPPIAVADFADDTEHGNTTVPLSAIEEDRLQRCSVRIILQDWVNNARGKTLLRWYPLHDSRDVLRALCSWRRSLATSARYANLDPAVTTTIRNKIILATRHEHPEFRPAAAVRARRRKGSKVPRRVITVGLLSSTAFLGRRHNNGGGRRC
jgi:hypothetical protein